jgi:hypothetical protein
MDTPSTASTSIFEVLLAIEMAMLSATSRWSLLPEIRLAGTITIEDVPLAAFFVVEDKRYGYTSTIGPLSIVAFFTKTLLYRQPLSGWVYRQPL